MGMNCYFIDAYACGRVLRESPRCPSYWRGSGVCDEEVKTYVDLELSVVAESEKEARKMVEDYDWDTPYTWRFDDIVIDQCKIVDGGYEDDDKGVYILNERWYDNDDTREF